VKRISLIFLLLLAAAPAAANDSPQTSFFRGNALYAEGKYGEAIEVYEGLAAEGYDGGHLRFNLGNAWFKAGDAGRAILNYERAEAWNPDDPDVEANLAYARSLSGAEPCTPAVWTALLFPLASRLSTWTLAVLASAAFALMLACLALRHVLTRPRRLLGYAAVLCLLVLAVSAASAGYRFVTEDLPLHAVVVAAGETPVRFEPDADGTTHFVAKQGTRLEISDRRDGWVQVGRCDGRRGWIEAQSIETL
jgi:tetratricopeptide (TPR) repeat protein